MSPRVWYEMVKHSMVQYSIGAQKTTETSGACIVVLRPATMAMPETMVILGSLCLCGFLGPHVGQSAGPHASYGQHYG